MPARTAGREVTPDSPTRNPAVLLQRLYRVTDLFKAGTEIVLDAEAEPPVLVWVQKLNSFHRADAQRDADYGRSRRAASMSEDSEEVSNVREIIAGYDDDELIQHIINPRSSEILLRAREDLLATEKWQERYPAMRDVDAARADGSYVSDEELAANEATAREFLDDLTKAIEQRTMDEKADLLQLGREELEDSYVESYKRMRTFDAFQDEYNRTEIWYALRDCVAVDVEGSWDHARCSHPQLLAKRSQVYDLPEPLLLQVQQALRELDIPPAEAGNSVAPRSSSASSEQPGTAEASTPSTPGETSTEQAGTSSTPSGQPPRSSDG